MSVICLSSRRLTSSFRVMGAIRRSSFDIMLSNRKNSGSQLSAPSSSNVVFPISPSHVMTARVGAAVRNIRHVFNLQSCKVASSSLGKGSIVNGVGAVCLILLSSLSLSLVLRRL